MAYVLPGYAKHFRAPDLTPSFPYLTMKARSKSVAGPWIKQPDMIPVRTKPKTYYADTASPGHIIKQGDEYLMFLRCFDGL